MNPQEVRNIIISNSKMKNPTARYRLSLPVLSYREVDIPDLEQGYSGIPDLDINAVRSLLFKDVREYRVYYKVTGDYISLSLESKGVEYPETDETFMDELSRIFKFAYRYVDIDAVLQKMPDEESLAVALQMMGIPYKVAGIERKDDKGSIHIAIQEAQNKKVYDIHLGLKGLTADEYKAAVRKGYWINRELCRAGVEEFYEEN